MSESYVDLAYRGLSLARRVKLTAVRPNEAYVEMPAPMPVGTSLWLSSEDGVAFAARVTGVTEQTGAAVASPGMQIAPVLDGAAATWWRERVELPEAPPPPKRLVIQPSAPAAAPAVAAPAHGPTTAPMPAAKPPDMIDGPTVPMPVIHDAPPMQDEPDADDPQSKRTRVMDAVVAEELLAELAADANPPVVVVEDDGKHTQVMEAVDLSALGLDSGASGSLRMITNSDVEGGGEDDDKSKPTAAGKKKRKRRT